MGDVVTGDFRHHRRHSGIESPAIIGDDGLTDEERIILDDVYWFQDSGNQESIQKSWLLCNRLLMVINPLVSVQESPGKQEKYRLAALTSTSFQKLCESLCASAECEWKEQPHFYAALYVELFVRVRLIQEFLDELTRIAYSRK